MIAEEVEVLRAPVAHAGNENLTLSTHNGQPTAACNYCYRKSNTLFWPLQTPTTVCTYKHT